MGVGDFVADDAGENPFGIKGFLLGFGYFFNHFEIFSGIGNLPDPAVVLFGNDLGVAGRLRFYIEKSQKIIILINDMGRNFFIGDFAEDAGSHIYIVSYDLW